MAGTRSLRGLRIEGEARPKASISWDQLEGSLLDRVTLRNLSPQYRQFLRQSLKPWREELADISPAEVSVKNMQQCILKWMQVVLKTRTINHRIRCIKILYNHAVKEGLVRENPAEKLEMQKEDAEPIQAFSDDQVRTLLAQPDKTTFVGYRDYCMMLVLLDTGMRLKELMALTLDDVELDRGVIRLNAANTKGRKFREVYIQKRCTETLRTYLKYRGKAGVETDSVWLSADTGEGLSRSDFQWRVRTYGRAAGIKGARCSPHTFRHTFARMFISAGGDGLVLMQILGHSSMDMVKRYVNLWSVDKKRLHARYSPVEHL